jgi:hypothetical protein
MNHYRFAGGDGVRDGGDGDRLPPPDPPLFGGPPFFGGGYGGCGLTGFGVSPPGVAGTIGVIGLCCLPLPRSLIMTRWNLISEDLSIFEMPR